MDKKSKFKIKKFRKGFTLIELMVSMFILILVMAAMATVAVSVFKSYQKSKSIKTVTEDVGFALNSFAKEVRMGKVESLVDNAGNTPSNTLLFTSSRTMTKVCYTLSSTLLNVCDGNCANCQSAVDLSGTSMTFDTATSGFRYQKTNTSVSPKVRGWAEINLNIESPSMATDSIHVQTTVSLRDYGWETTP